MTTLEQLAVHLQDRGLSPTHYSLGRHREERTCLIEDGGRWLVYFAERGRREDMHAFASLEEAGAFLISELTNEAPNPALQRTASGGR